MKINQTELKARLPKLVKDFAPLFADSGLSDEQVARVVRLKAGLPSTGTIKAAKTSNGEAELLIYEQIGLDWWTGEGMTPKKLADELDALKPFDKLTVRINSPGGDVFDGTTIFNILRRQEAAIEVEIEGIVASAASYIAQVADAGKLRVSEAGMVMVHFAMGGMMIYGNKQVIEEECDRMCEILDKIDNQIATIYANRSGRKIDDWLSMMEEETWLTGQEAVDEKFADEVMATTRGAKEEDKPQDKRSALPLAAAARVRLLDLEEEAA